MKNREQRLVEKLCKKMGFTDDEVYQAYLLYEPENEDDETEVYDYLWQKYHLTQYEIELIVNYDPDAPIRIPSITKLITRLKSLVARIKDFMRYKVRKMRPAIPIR